jgi:predicted Zn-dependent peptidase
MYKKYDCKNGVKIITSRMPGMTSVSLGVWIGVGGRNENREENGISHLIEHMLFKGTGSRDTKELKQSIEGVGGAFNGFTSDEVTCYMVKVPAKYVNQGVDILADMILDPKFDESDLAKEKYVICEEIKMYRDQPADHVMDTLGEIMWPDSSLGRPLTGTESIVKNISREKMIEFKEKHYHPGNIAFIAAGKVDSDRFNEYISAKFEHWKKRKREGIKELVFSQNSPKLKILKKKTRQVHMAMGFRASADSWQKRYAVKVMNVILGGNMSSRLFENLRESQGLCYDVGSSYKRHIDVGELHIHAGVDNSKLVRSVSGIVDEIIALKDSDVGAEEIKRAKEFIKGQFLLAMEATSTRMLWLGDRLFVHKNIPQVKKVLERVDAVTAKDIISTAREFFIREGVNLAMIGSIRDEQKKKIIKELYRI